MIGDRKYLFTQKPEYFAQEIAKVPGATETYRNLSNEPRDTDVNASGAGLLKKLGLAVESDCGLVRTNLSHTLQGRILDELKKLKAK